MLSINTRYNDPTRTVVLDVDSFSPMRGYDVIDARIIILHGVTSLRHFLERARCGKREKRTLIGRRTSLILKLQNNLYYINEINNRHRARRGTPRRFSRRGTARTNASSTNWSDEVGAREIAWNPTRLTTPDDSRYPR